MRGATTLGVLRRLRNAVLRSVTRKPFATVVLTVEVGGWLQAPRDADELRRDRLLRKEERRA